MVGLSGGHGEVICPLVFGVGCGYGHGIALRCPSQG